MSEHSPGVERMLRTNESRERDQFTFPKRSQERLIHNIIRGSPIRKDNVLMYIEYIFILLIKAPYSPLGRSIRR
jgi:hypothetical protein